MNFFATSPYKTLLRKHVGCSLGGVLLGMLLLFSCSSHSQGWKKIDLKDVQRLLPQMLLAEAIYDQRGLPDSTRILGYQSILGESGYRLADWDSTLVWYGKYRVFEYQKAYDYAMNVLSLQQEDLQRRVDSLAQIEARAHAWRSGQADSINLLPDSISYHRLGSYLERSFDYRPELPYSEGVGLRFALRLAGFSPKSTGGSLRLQLRYFFADSTSQTEEVRSLRPGLTLQAFSVPTGKQLTRISGVLRGVAPRGKGKWLVIDSLSLARYSSSFASPAPEEASVSAPADSLPPVEDLEAPTDF